MTSQWRVKYEGKCSRCSLELPAGSIAIYERSTRTIHCVECPSRSSGAKTAMESLDTGVAGASAAREHERRRASRDARVRGRFGDRIGGLVLAVTTDSQSTRAWAKGAAGEEKLGRALEGVEGLRALHDRRVPGSRANIDHIVVAPAGVFVVDAKHYTGAIQIRDRGLLRSDPRLYVGGRDCSVLADKLRPQVAAVTEAIRGAGIAAVGPITPVLCFVDGEWPILSPPREFRGVRLEGQRSIRKLVTASSSIDAATIEAIAHALALALPAR